MVCHRYCGRNIKVFGLHMIATELIIFNHNFPQCQILRQDRDSETATVI